MKKTKKTNRSWWRELFLDHPGMADRLPSALIASGTGLTKATKVYCRLCFSGDVNRAIEADTHAIAEGMITAIRSEAQIEAYREWID
jgi:hypothetical protein